MVVAALVLSGLSWLVHRYVWARLVRHPRWPEPWGTASPSPSWSSPCSFPSPFLAMRSAAPGGQRPLSWVAYSWMGLLLYLFLLTVLSDAGRGVAALLGALPSDPARRLFLSRMIAAGVGGGVRPHRHRRRGQRGARLRRPARARPAGQAAEERVGLHHRAAHRRARGADHRPRLRRGQIVRADERARAGHDRHHGGPRRRLGGGAARAGRAAARPASEGRRLLRDRQPRVLLGRRRVDRPPRDAGHPRAAQRARRRARPLRSRGRRRLEQRRGCSRTTGRTWPGRMEGRDPSRAVVLLAHQPKAVRDARAGDGRPPALRSRARRAAGPFNWLARLDQPLHRGPLPRGDDLGLRQHRHRLLGPARCAWGRARRSRASSWWRPTQAPEQLRPAWRRRTCSSRRG